MTKISAWDDFKEFMKLVYNKDEDYKIRILSKWSKYRNYAWRFMRHQRRINRKPKTKLKLNK